MWTANENREAKTFADKERRAQENKYVTEGDTELLQQEKLNQLTPRYEDKLYNVVGKNGGHVEVESPTGETYKRNITQMKKYEEDQSTQETLETKIIRKDEDFNSDGIQEESVPRPVRNRTQHKYLQDYEL